MKISELSKKTGISQRMLRYYEQEGLLDPARSESDYREYEELDEKRILEIREWQRLGLTLREVKTVFSNHTSADQVLEAVLYREREVFNQKERALRDLKERLLGQKSSYFKFRVAHPIPNLDKVLSHMDRLGWKPKETNYYLYSEWRDEAEVGHVMFGEMLLRSAFYLLRYKGELGPVLDRLMCDFCSAARSQWANFDGSPPKEIESADLGDFFGPLDIVVCLKFNSEKDENLTILLPYQAIFALAQGVFAEPEFLK